MVGQWYLEDYNKNIRYYSTDLEETGTEMIQIVGPDQHPSFIHAHANIRDHIFDFLTIYSIYFVFLLTIHCMM